jgi:hypothetical protein
MNRLFNKKYKELENHFDKATEELKDKPMFSWNDLQDAKKEVAWPYALLGFSIAFILFLFVEIYIRSSAQ